MQWWHLYMLTLAGAAAISAVSTWIARLIGYRLEIVDQPDSEAHKQHRHAIPVLGGTAMFTAWIMVLAGGFLIFPALRPILRSEVVDYIPNLKSSLPRIYVTAGGAAAMLLLGMLDDKCPLGAFQKLFVQASIALAVAFYGVRITIFIAHPYITCLITAAWIVIIVNGINFFDNTDGLAGGTAAVAAFIFMLGAGMREQYFVAVLAASTCGIALGFLIFNWPPATIFMGDAGSHLLGYLLAITGALATYYQPGAGMTRLSVLIPLLVLAVPIYDFFAVIVIRRLAGRPIYQGDHSHISHRFMAMGLSKGSTIVLVHLLNFIIGASALTLFWLPLAGALIVMLQAVTVLALVTILHAARIGQANA